MGIARRRSLLVGLIAIEPTTMRQLPSFAGDTTVAARPYLPVDELVVGIVFI
jgi:hypothetical protein